MSRIWIWVWTISECEGGDLGAIVAKAKERGVGVMVKVHDGATTNPNGAAGYELVRRLVAAGVPTRAWGYCYPDVDPRAQAELAARAGVDYVADTEGEWDGKTDEARALVDALREAMPGQLIGYAPLPVISQHQAGDIFGHAQYGEFNRLDVVLPQAYAGTGGRDAIGALEWTADEWSHAFPAGVNLEPAVYAAYEIPGELAKAIGLVRTNARAFGHDGDLSVWSWQHMTAQHWAEIERYVVPAASPAPAPTAIPRQDMPPEYAGQSADAQLPVGSVALFTGVWTYIDGSRHARSVKRFAHEPGRYIVEILPLAEDLVTEHADATPARCVLDVTAS